MDHERLRRLIQDKLANGSLPHDSIPRMWGGPGVGETCDACGESITKLQMLMEGISATGPGVQMHVVCFYLWDAERQALGHEPSAPSGSGQ